MQGQVYTLNVQTQCRHTPMKLKSETNYNTYTGINLGQGDSLNLTWFAR